jgi:outer membrane protein
MAAIRTLTALLLLALLCLDETVAGETPDGAGPGEVISLSLENCVFRAYSNNVAILIGRDAAASAATFFGEAQGAFDPVFFASANGGETRQPSGSQLIGNFSYATDYTEDTFFAQSGIRGMLLSGATYQVDMAVARSYQLNAGVFSINPRVSSNAGIQIKQPLLRNGWTTYNRSESFKAVLGSRREDLTLENTLSDTVFATIQAYWNLDYEIRNLETTLKSLELARDLLRINTRKKEEGIFTKMEVLEASADVATRKEQVLTARNSVKMAEDSLKKLIIPDVGLNACDMKIELLTEASPAGRKTYDLDSLLCRALENRADYLALLTERKSREVEFVQAENQALPNLDLTGDYRYNSLGTNIGNSFEDIEARKYRSFSVALSLEVPLGNRTAKYREKRAAIELRKAISSQRSKKIDISYELREGVREIALQAEKVNAARGSKQLSLERYDGELKRLKAGRSISYLVREAERNHYLESVKENRARLDLQIALARLEKTTGSLMDKYGFTVGRSLSHDWIYSNL